MELLLIMAATTLLIMMLSFLSLTQEDRELARDEQLDQVQPATPLTPREDVQQAA